MAESTFSLERSEVHQQRTFLWTIPNFKNLCISSVENQTRARKFANMDFTTGEESIGIQTNWRFYLKFQDKSVVGIYLKFLGPGSYSAKYKVHKKCYPDKEFKCAGKKPKERFTNSKIEGTVSDSALNLGTFQEIFENYLHDNELQLQIKLTVYYPSEIHFKGELSKDLKNGLDSGVTSDVTFVFLEEGTQKVIAQIKAHKSTLAFRSPVFSAMFDSDSGMTEATEGKVTISDMNPKAMRILLKFIYTGVVDAEWISVAGELIRATNKYELEEFKKFLSENIFFALTPKNVYKIWDLGGLYKLPKVVETTRKFMKENFDECFPLHGMFVTEEEEQEPVLMDVVQEEPGA